MAARKPCPRVFCLGLQDLQLSLVGFIFVLLTCPLGTHASSFIGLDLSSNMVITSDVGKNVSLNTNALNVNGVDLMQVIQNLQKSVILLQSIVAEQNRTIVDLRVQLVNLNSTLTNLSNGSNGSIQQQPSSTSAYLKQVAFTSSGPYSWVVPNGVSKVRVSLAGGGTCSGNANPNGTTTMTLASTVLVAIGGNNTAHGSAYATNLPAGSESALLTVTGGGAVGAVGFAAGGGNGGLLVYTASVQGGQTLSGVVGSNAVNLGRVQADGAAATGYVMIEYVLPS